MFHMVLRINDFLISEQFLPMVFYIETWRVFSEVGNDFFFPQVHAALSI
jgi:hypothetical protein